MRSLFLGLAAAVGLAGNAWWYHRAGYAPELFAAAEGVLPFCSASEWQAYCAIGARGRRVQEKMGRRRRRRQSAAAEDAVRIRLAESEKAEQTPACRVGGNTRGEGNETMQSGGTAGSMQRSGRTGELQLELDAVEMAKNEIIRLSREYGDERRDEINSVVSDMSLRLQRKIRSGGSGRNGKARVQTGREVLPEALSRGTLEQFYFAFRMAVGSIVTQEEPLPLLLDETFAMYDDARLRQTLRLLAANGTQTIPVYLPETGAEAVGGTGNRISHDRVIVPFTL